MEKELNERSTSWLKKEYQAQAKVLNTQGDLMYYERIREELQNRELNTCDKCGYIGSTYDLIWITSDDFEPKKNERVPKELYEKYDALCKDCYLEEIIILK